MRSPLDEPHPPEPTAAELAIKAAFQRTLEEQAAHEHALAADARWREASDELIRIALAPVDAFGARAIDPATKPGYNEARRREHEARTDLEEALRIDNLNDRARMERQRREMVRQSELIATAQRQREQDELYRRASSIGGRVARLLGRER